MLEVAGISTDKIVLRRLPAATPRVIYAKSKEKDSKAQVSVGVTSQFVYAVSAAAYVRTSAARSLRVESLDEKTLKTRFVPKLARPDTF